MSGWNIRTTVRLSMCSKTYILVRLSGRWGNLGSRGGRNLSWEYCLGFTGPDNKYKEKYLAHGAFLHFPERYYAPFEIDGSKPFVSSLQALITLLLLQWCAYTLASWISVANNKGCYSCGVYSGKWAFEGYESQLRFDFYI
jgi:hypothetical protein